MALIIVTWRWGDKYAPEYVDRLAAGIKQHLRSEHQFVCITDSQSVQWTGIQTWQIPHEDRYLLNVKGCFARLRMFDPAWQAAHGIKDGDLLICIDLDVVITGLLDPLFNRPEPFVILQGANAQNPCPYNGSVFLLQSGAHHEVWSDFNLDAASEIAFYEFPDDQGWLAHKIPNSAGWKAGSESQIYAFAKPGWPKGEALPSDARMVAFPGWRSPEKFKHLPWIQQHWRL